MKSRRIMLVDDNAEAVLPLQELLQMEGHTVKVVTEPVSALTLGRQLRPEIAILDIDLPVMSGYELVARLRALPELAGCLFIALTGYGSSQDREQSSVAGFEHHLRKPVDIALLLRILDGPGRGDSRMSR